MSHLRPETIFGYEHGLLLPDELRAVHQHVESCESCRELLAERMGAAHVAGQLKAALATAEAPAPPSKWRFYGVAAGVVPFPISLLGALLETQRRTSSEPALAAKPASTGSGWIRYAAAAAVLVTAVGAWFWLRGRPPVEPELAVMRLPAFLADLADQRRELMGAEPGEAGRLVSPRATAVSGPTVAFAWTPLEGAGWRYLVRVFRLEGEPVTASEQLTEPRWTATLPPGMNYQWQVTATRPGAEPITLPGPSERPPRFRLLDGSVATRLPRGDALRRGITCANEGLIDDARRELGEAAQRDARAAALLDQLNNRR